MARDLQRTLQVSVDDGSYYNDLQKYTTLRTKFENVTKPTSTDWKDTLRKVPDVTWAFLSGISLASILSKLRIMKHLLLSFVVWPRI